MRPSFSYSTVYDGPVGFKLPEVPESKDWRLLVDTNSPQEASSFAFGATYEVAGRLFLAFMKEPS
jgi:hypothetical protein